MPARSNPPGVGSISHRVANLPLATGTVKQAIRVGSIPDAGRQWLRSPQPKQPDRAGTILGMAVRDILVVEHPVLRQKAKKVARVDASIVRLLDELTETM